MGEISLLIPPLPEAAHTRRSRLLCVGTALCMYRPAEWLLMLLCGVRCGVRQVTLAEVLGPTAPATLRSLLTPYFIPVVQQPAPSIAPSIAPAPPSFPFYAKAQFPFDGALLVALSLLDPPCPSCMPGGWCRDSVFLQGFATAT
jgi:hypothetical protein